MNSKLKWAAALAAIALVAGGAIPWRMWSEAPARELAVLGRALTGLDARTGARASIRLLPQPVIDFERVTLAGPDGAIVLSVERLRSELRLAALLRGRLEFSAIRLVDPTLTTNSDVLDDLAAPLRAFAAHADSGGARPDVLEISGGRAEIASASGTRVLERINASLNWEDTEAAAASGSFMTEGEKFSLEALLGKPLELMRGDDSPFTLKIASRLLDLSLNGTASGGARWLLEARIAATSERLRPLLGLLDMRPPLPGRLGRFALSGQLRALPQTALLSDLKLAIDGNAFDGSLSLRVNEDRHILSGTLATRALEFSSNDLGLQNLRAQYTRGEQRGWSREPLGAPNLASFDADLRISAAKARLGRFMMSDAGVLLKLTDGALEAILADSQAYGGKLRGRLTLEAANDLSLGMTATFANVESGQMLRDLAGAPRVHGAASGELSLAAKGGSIQALVNDLRGSVRGAIGKGELVGLDIEQAVRRAERRPLSIPSDMRSGQTTFISADVEASIAGGALTLNTARVIGHGVEMNVVGGIELDERALRLSVAAAPPRTNAGAPREPVLLLDIAGPWDDPRLSLDAENLIRRSRAAAPLLRRPDLPEPIKIEPADLEPNAALEQKSEPASAQQ
jgi:AsmA protein